MVWPIAEDSYGPEELEDLRAETLVRSPRQARRPWRQVIKAGKRRRYSPFDHLQYSDDAVYGGATPAWTEIGGYDIAGDKVIEGKDGFDEPGRRRGRHAAMGYAGPRRLRLRR